LSTFDIANETPYFFPNPQDRLKKETGAGFEDTATFSPAPIAFLADEINKPLAFLRRGFPELRFTTSIHGEPLRRCCGLGNATKRHSLPIGLRKARH
jgi:hypothetical protein